MAVSLATALIASAVVGGAASVASTAIQSSAARKTAGLLGPATTSAPAAPPSQADTASKARDEARKRALERTRTIYTSPLGISDASLKTAPKPLLGS